MKTRTILTVAALTLFAAPPSHAKEGVVQCANLIYAGTVTSRCFSDEFLSEAQRKTTIKTERRFKPVKMASDELFKYPFAIMTGEGDFRLAGKEREKLKKYLNSGGFLLASAGCSSASYDTAFRTEMKTIFGAGALKRIDIKHPIYRTVKKIEQFDMKSDVGEVFLEGVEVGGKLVVVYSKEGLNDTSHTEGCCCCGGNEIRNSLMLNVNIFAYALLH